MPPPWGGGNIISKIYRTKDVISTETHPWGKKLCFRTGRTNPRGIGFPPLGGGIPRGGEFWGDVGYKILIHHIITRNQEIHTSQVLNSTCPLHSISRGIGFPHPGESPPRGGGNPIPLGLVLPVLKHNFFHIITFLHTSQILNSTCPLQSISTHQKQK